MYRSSNIDEEDHIEGHVLRRMLDSQVPGKEGEKGRQPGGKTCVNDVWKGVSGGGRIEQDKLEE